MDYGYARVNGTRLYYEITGTGIPLVLIHGLGLDSRMWNDQVAAFSQRYQVIRYDMRGFGKSDAIVGSYRSADDLKGLLDYLQLRSAVMLGLSLGGWVAINFAITYPEHTLALIPVDSALSGYRFSPEHYALLETIYRIGGQDGAAAANEAWLRHPLFQSLQLHSHAAARLTEMIRDYSGWHWVNEDPEQSPVPPAIESLTEISAPALVITGAHDTPDFQAIADILSRRISNVQKVVIPDAGHMVNMEQPEVFNTTVIGFLQQHLTPEPE